MKRKTFLAAIVAVTVMVASGHVFASGSDAGASAKTGEAAAYQLGKQVFAKKYACKSCPLHKQRLNKGMASQILEGEPKVDLSQNEAKALQVFLQRRFKL